MVLDHDLSPSYPPTAEPVFEFYYGNTRAAMLADSPEIKSAVDVMNSDFFSVVIGCAQSAWVGFRARMGRRSGPMQIVQFAVLDKPESPGVVPSGGGTVHFGWTGCSYAAGYKVYVSKAEPDDAKSWAENKASLTAAHKLSYKGAVSDTGIDIRNMPNHATRYYIVAPTNSAGVEGWFFAYKRFRLDY